MSIAAALLLALQGGAVPGSLSFDVRCMITFGQLSQSDDATVRSAASTASQYYFGRIDGRVADAELEAVIWRETRTMRTDEQAALVQACAAHMQRRGQRLAEIGNRISARDGQPAQR
jgi:hypothetical protein